ncbi:MAG: hybrid sensor histidine kinase/response regulator [Ramlibacter sp.]|nr:hybrid sensor histidine kinase/response regulator [Ramlibacter sp.]
MKALNHPPLSVEGQAYLLNLIMTRRTAELALLTLPALLMAVHAQDAGAPLALMPWVLAMAALALLLAWMRHRYTDDRARLGSDRLTTRWRGRAAVGAFVYGLFWVAPLGGWVDSPTPVFASLFYLVLAGITAAAALYLSAVFSALLGFMLGIWPAALVAAPHMLPAHSGTLQALGVLFCIVIAQHGMATHRFLRRQIRLEEFNQQLADQYRLARNQAEAALNEKTQFLRVASHDLRQPLQAMTMLVAALDLRNQDAGLRPVLSDLRRSMDGMGLMFNALLDLSRLESRARPAHLQPLALGPLLAEMATLFSAQALHRQLTLRVRAAPADAQILANPVLVRQALSNLVHNALRYTRHGGLLLGARRRGAGWQIEVWDTGIGIAPQETPRIFTADYRHEAARHMDDTGQGLGLAVVARCAELMGAQRGFTSRVGRGSRFWLWLAAPPTEGAPARPAPAAPTEPLPRLGGRCLILEDNPEVAAAWVTLLDSWGVESRIATSGREALEYLDQGFAPRAILCDQNLRTGESGFEVLQALVARCPEAGAAMVSGEHHSPALAQAEHEGYLVLKKPLAPEALHALLSHWLRHPTELAPA